MKETPYRLELKSKTSKGKEKYVFSSADGISSKNSFREAEIALADNLKAEKDDETLVYHSGFGFLPVIISDQCPNADTLAATSSDRSHQLTELNIEKNNVSRCESRKVAFCSDIDRKFNKIAYAPEGYSSEAAVKNRISNMESLLKNDGEILIAGQKTSGIKRYRNYLDSMNGNVEKVAQKGKQRVYRFSNSGNTSLDSPEVEYGYTASIESEEASFSTFEGLFSYKNLDEGSRLLIESAEIAEDEEVLDLGCGYGAIGVFLKKLHNPEIFLSDDDRTATHYAEKNLRDNGITEYVLKNRDCLDGFTNRKFDLIVSNPPTHQGKGVTDEIFEESYDSLRDGGRLVIVYNQNMNFEEKLKRKFVETETLATEDNYKVLEATK